MQGFAPGCDVAQYFRGPSVCFFVSQSSLPLLGGTTPSCLIHSPVMDIWLVFSFHLIFKLASFIPDPKYLLETSPIFFGALSAPPDSYVGETGLHSHGSEEAQRRLTHQPWPQGSPGR